MEVLLPVLLTCSQANLIVSRLYAYEMPEPTRLSLVWELQKVSPKKCTLSPIKK